MLEGSGSREGGDEAASSCGAQLHIASFDALLAVRATTWKQSCERTAGFILSSEASRRNPGNARTERR